MRKPLRVQHASPPRSTPPTVRHSQRGDTRPSVEPGGLDATHLVAQRSASYFLT